MKILVKVGITKTYGNTQIFMGMEYEAEVSTSGERHIAYEKALAHVTDEHNRYLDENAAHLGAAETTDGQWVVMDTLNLEAKNGKRYYYIKGGEYAQHGVAIYPEVLKAHGLETIAADMSYPVPLGGSMLVISGSKGRKVSQLRLTNGKVSG